jgi:hypothetical protein
VPVAQQNTQPDGIDGDDEDASVFIQDHQHALLPTDHTKELLDLRQIVSSRQLMIEKLRSQLSFVISFLGVTETEMRQLATSGQNLLASYVINHAMNMPSTRLTEHPANPQHGPML